jgi:hypothetical protein
MTHSVLLTHLGESVPPYLKDCLHQLRLWNLQESDAHIFLILEPCHRDGPTAGYWSSLASQYLVTLVFTDTLPKTPHHKDFLEQYEGDLAFRKGYWRHVKERFFFNEEAIIKYKLTNCLAIEYDVLFYMPIKDIIDTLKNQKPVLRYVMDNEERGHPGCIFIPTSDAIRGFNIFLFETQKHRMDDMQTLACYMKKGAEYALPLPVISHAVNQRERVRISITGERISKDPWFLSDGSDILPCFFDSAVVGQYVGGIDSRNTGGEKISKYENESALYTFHELDFKWKKNVKNYLWQPQVCGKPLCMIHVHSKALSSFLSDRKSEPRDDYDVATINKGLLPNQ